MDSLGYIYFFYNFALHLVKKIINCFFINKLSYYVLDA